MVASSPRSARHGIEMALAAPRGSAARQRTAAREATLAGLEGRPSRYLAAADHDKKSERCYPAPDLVFQKPIFLIVKPRSVPAEEHGREEGCGTPSGFVVRGRFPHARVELGSVWIYVCIHLSIYICVFLTIYIYIYI